MITDDHATDISFVNIPDNGGPTKTVDYTYKFTHDGTGWFGWCERKERGKATGDEITTEVFQHKKTAVDRLRQMVNKMGWDDVVIM